MAAASRKHSHDYAPRASFAVEQRMFRKLFSSRGVMSRYPGVISAFAYLGFITCVILGINLLVSAVLYLNVPEDNNRYVDRSGVPTPLFVIAGGAPRTGSTLIFNILRVLLRIRDPNTVASSDWMLAKLVPQNNISTDYDRIELLRSMGTSMLVKVHTKKQYYDFVGSLHTRKFADEVDLLVTGYRDLREETVSAYKMFAKNRTEYDSEIKWSELCKSLIRRRNSLIVEAGNKVPVVDIRYEDWKDGGSKEVTELIRKLARSIPWTYSESDIQDTFDEVQRLRVPSGGGKGSRVDWHLSNLMSPRHISREHLSEELVRKGMHAVINEPKCAKWLKDKRYVL